MELSLLCFFVHFFIRSASFFMNRKHLNIFRDDFTRDKAVRLKSILLRRNMSYLNFLCHTPSAIIVVVCDIAEVTMGCARYQSDIKRSYGSLLSSHYETLILECYTLILFMSEIRK